MSELAPRTPARPLLWPDFVLDLRNRLANVGMPVYIVGGAVRDAYLGRPIKDLDLATPDHSIRLARRITDLFDGDIYIMDRERGVARVFVQLNNEKLTIDVARYRGATLLDDLLDRDFTINAMVVDLRGDLGKLIDPLNAEDDVSKKFLRRCSPDSIANDPIRALRAVRQSAQLAYRIAPETLADIRCQSVRLRNASPERLRDEFFSLLSLGNPATALRIAYKLGLLEQLLPEVSVMQNLAQQPPHVYDVWTHTLRAVEKLSKILLAISPARADDTVAVFDLGMLVMQLDRWRGQLQGYLGASWANDRPHRALLILAALLHNVGKAKANPPRYEGYREISVEVAVRFADDLRLSHAEKQHLAAVLAHYRFPLDSGHLTKLDLHRFWYRVGVAGIDVCLLALADYMGMTGTEFAQDEWLMLVDRVRALLEAYYEYHDTVVKPALLLDGHQLMQEFSLKSGPIVGKLLTMIREGQVTGEIKSVEDARKAVEQYLEG